MVGIPIGYLSDRIGKEKALILAYTVFLFTCITCLGTSFILIFLIPILYGAYFGMLETIQRALIPEYVPKEYRATGYGIYYLIVGLSFLIANSVVGSLWDTYGYTVAFQYSIVTSLIAILLLIIYVTIVKK